MSLDYSIGPGYLYQWLVATYIYMIFKENTYIEDTSIQIPSNLTIFKKNIELFKSSCENKFGSNFNTNIKIMLEGYGKCFEDINLLSTNTSGLNDNLIFIQVKSKGGKEPITKTNGVLKAIKNFVENINFQKDKIEPNYLFFIFTNKDLSPQLINELKGHNVKLYQSIINFIIIDNNKRKTTKKDYYPNKTLANFSKTKSIFTNSMLIDLLNKDFNDINLNNYTKYFDLKYLNNLYKLITDLKIVINNLNIIESIGFNILEHELEQFYTKDGFKVKAYDNGRLSGDKRKIYNHENEFLQYKEYKHTYFKDNLSLITDLEYIEKGKFIT